MEFGPCKHGKFSETEYQETFVYDIVSHSDAMRHPVMVDDNVLAPWEPEGERYAPAVVISGLEKRMADGKTLIDVDVGFLYLWSLHVLLVVVVHVYFSPSLDVKCAVLLLF